MIDPYIDKLTIDLLLSELSVQDRDIITLWFIEGYKIEEISKILRERYGEMGEFRSVSLRITEIIERLRKKVGYHGDLIYRIRNRRKGAK